jgi:lipid A disaccharide synthetase
MNISELKDSEAMSKVISSRRGEIKEKLMEFLDAADEDFNRHHASSFVLENTAPREHDFQVDAVVATVRKYFNTFEHEGIIERTGKKSRYGTYFYRRTL